MLLAFAKLFDGGLFCMQKAMAIRIFFKILPILDIYSNKIASPVFSLILIGIKKLKKVPEQ